MRPSRPILIARGRMPSVCTRPCCVTGWRRLPMSTLSSDGLSWRRAGAVNIARAAPSGDDESQGFCWRWLGLTIAFR
jgi:hypothetical protein